MSVVDNMIQGLLRLLFFFMSPMFKMYDKFMGVEQKPLKSDFDDEMSVLILNGGEEVHKFNSYEELGTFTDTLRDNTR